MLTLVLVNDMESDKRQENSTKLEKTILWKVKNTRNYSGSAPVIGNDLRPLDTIINVELQRCDQRTRVPEFHRP